MKSIDLLPRDRGKERKEEEDARERDARDVKGEDFPFTASASSFIFFFSFESSSPDSMKPFLQNLVIDFSTEVVLAEAKAAEA